MPEQTTKTIPADGTWTRINTAAIAGDLSIALLNPVPIWLTATTDTTTPTNEIGPLTLNYPGNGWSEATISEKFPGTGTGSNAAYLWGKVTAGNVAAIVGYTAQT